MNIYLSGAMSDVSEKEANDWRTDVGDYFGNDDSVKIFNPVAKNELTDSIEAMQYDLDKLKVADLVIVNFNYQRSIGTAMELGYALHMGIPIIGLNETGEKLHSWLSSSCRHVFNDFIEMINFVNNYYVDY